MSLYAEERQQQILMQTRAGGRVEVAALAETLGVTQETVRRDLDRLERQGLVRRVHGGAIPTGRLDFEPGLNHRDATASSEKARMARLAAGLLPREGTVLLDAGTSTARVAAALPEDSHAAEWATRAVARIRRRGRSAGVRRTARGAWRDE